MKKFIPYEKLSKKKKKKFDSARRKQWCDFGCISPISRVVTDKKKEESKRKCRSHIEGDR